MSRELLKFPDLIDGHFVLPDPEPEDFWLMTINMFI